MLRNRKPPKPRKFWWKLSKMAEKCFSVIAFPLTIQIVTDLMYERSLFRQGLNRQHRWRYSSVDLSVPSILPPWVWVPSTPSTLFSNYIDLSCGEARNKQKRGRDWPIFFKKNIGQMRLVKRCSETVWPDDEIKVAQFFFKKYCPKSIHNSFDLISDVLYP